MTRQTQLLVPSPMRVSQSIIDRCRVEVEPRLKRRLRSYVVPLLKRHYRFGELGEGFQFGRGIAIGSGSRVGRYCYIGGGFESRGPLSIGDLCMISKHVKIVV
jgi:hypothetical protein